MPRIVKYFFAGGCAAAVDIGIFLALISLGLHYWLAAILSFIIATAANLFLSVHFVFPDRRTSRTQAALGVYLISGVGLLLNLFILWIGIEQLGSSPVAAKLTATGLVFFWNYFARKQYVFNVKA